MKREKISVDEKKKIIISYLRNNSKATYKDIRKDTKLHPERIFKGLKEAYELANIKPPRIFDVKSREERKNIIAEYIRKNPSVGFIKIRKNLKTNLLNSFKSIQEAYQYAGVDYPRKKNIELNKRSKSEKIDQIIKLVKINPLISVSEIAKETNTNPYKIFKNMKEINKKAGIRNIRWSDKRILKKQIKIIEFIKKNPLATQREINKACNTHVQNTFKRGIFEAYEKAEVKFPFERLKIYGIGLENIRKRSKAFEDEIAIKLSGYGRVNRLVKTKRGFADIILERNNKKVVIEVKDYLDKEISSSQIKQLNKYLEDCKCNLGFLICHNKPKKDRFLIGKNRIFVLDSEDLRDIPDIIDGSVV